MTIASPLPQATLSRLLLDNPMHGLVVASGEIDLAAAVADQSPLYVPYPVRIQSMNIVYPTAPDADAIIFVGTLADPNKFAGHTAVLALTDGAREDDVDLILNQIDAGDVLVFGSDGGSTSAAVAHVTLVLSAR